MEQLPELGELLGQGPDRGCTFLRGLQANCRGLARTKPEKQIAGFTLLPPSPASHSHWPNPTRSRTVRERMDAIHTVSLWGTEQGGHKDRGTSQHMGNNQHRHLLVKRLVVTSDKPYPN